MRGVFTANRLFVLVLFLQTVLGLLAIQEKPLFENNSDEIGHLLMVRYVASQAQLPGQDDVDWSTDTLQFTQPPLYYVLLSPLIRAIDDGAPIPGQPNPMAVCHDYNANMTNWARPQNFSVAETGAVRTGYLLRGIQLLLALATTVFTFLSARLLFSMQSGTAVSAAALIAFLPSLVSTTAYIGNDWPVICIGACALYLTLRSLRTTRARHGLIGFSAVLVLGLIAALSKVTGWTVFVLLLPILAHLRTTIHIPRRLIVVLLVSVPIAVILLAGFNLATYGSLIGRYPSTWLSMYLPVDEVVRLATNDFWNSVVLKEQFNANAVPMLVRLQAATLLIVGVSIVWLAVRSLRSWRLARRLGAPALLLCAGLGLVLVRNLTAVNELYIFAPFRYLGAGIPALAIVAAAGLASLPGIVGHAAKVLIPAAWLVLTILGVTLSDSATMQREAHTSYDTLPANATPVEAAQAGLPLRVEGYQVDAGDTLDDGLIELTLYLAGQETPSDGLAMLEFEIDDTLCRVLPARGFRPNTSIAGGEHVEARFFLPYCGREQDAAIPITLAWRNVSVDGTTTSRMEALPLSLVTLPEGHVRPASGCWPNLGLVDDKFQIIHATFPASVASGETLEPSVNWLTLASTPDSYLRVYALTDAHGDEIARCQEVPRLGTYPTDRWREGEVIYNDRCTLSLPDTLTAGDIDLWIGMFDPVANRYLPHNGEEDADLLKLGTITVTE